MTIHFAPKAEADFAALVGYVAERNPTAADELADRIFAVIGDAVFARSAPMAPTGGDAARSPARALQLRIAKP